MMPPMGQPPGPQRPPMPLPPSMGAGAPPPKPPGGMPGGMGMPGGGQVSRPQALNAFHSLIQMMQQSGTPPDAAMQQFIQTLLQYFRQPEGPAGGMPPMGGPPPMGGGPPGMGAPGGGAGMGGGPPPMGGLGRGP